MDEKLSSGTRELYRYFSVSPPEEIMQIVFPTIEIGEIERQLIEYLKTGKIPESAIAQFHVDILPAKDDN